MKLLENILVPVDFGPSSLKALDNAVMLAKAFNSQITLLHVLADTVISAEHEQLMNESVIERLNHLKDKVREQGIATPIVQVEKGVAFEKIIEIAHKTDANVIVAGAGSKTPGDTFKLGTTAEKLIRKNQIPLWVVKNQEVKPIKKILCPVDFSDSSKRALQNAITVSGRFNAELTVLNVFVPFNYFSMRFQVDNVKENNTQKKCRNRIFIPS
ncbi:MAG: universal stress protein [Bacteroidales bacterium]|nr:universal stress protein [Bacteroidales bacterium]